MTVGARNLNADNVAVVNCLNGDRIICENVGADFRGIVHSVPEFLNELFRVRDSDVLYLSFSVVIGRYRSLSVVIGRYRSLSICWTRGARFHGRYSAGGA